VLLFGGVGGVCGVWLMVRIGLVFVLYKLFRYYD